VPELPEAERARALIAAQALGRRITGVEDGDSYVCRPHAPGELAGALLGRRLTSANRIGKMLWLETDGEGPDLGLHLGMAGRIAIDEPPHPLWDRFVLTFADGGRLALRDKRRLGRAILEPDLARLGPDAALATRAEFRARVGRGGGAIKARRAANDLSEAELDALRRAVRTAIRHAIRNGGAHSGALIAHRERDGRCPRCGAPLSRARIGGRTTYWCPQEQRTAGD
jgi:formamidopyrimidine-DNA glycosylase